ncbi:MAG: hypothetical protein QM722_18980 [Piscinibacter sp.]
MPDTPFHHEVCACTLRVSDLRDGFVMEVNSTAREAIRLEFPEWVLHQLMRTLPRIDAALRCDGPGLPAYPLLAWAVDPDDAGQGVALQLRNIRLVDAAFHLELDTAQALHRELGRIIDSASADAGAEAARPS